LEKPGEICGMASELLFGQFISAFTKELEDMFSRVIEEAVLDMHDCMLIMLDI
jgi:hypothetical protein